MERLGPGDPERVGVYRLLGRLGAGGMGQVYLARSDRGRTVAVKLVREELAAQEEFRGRFRQEVQAARRVGGHWTAPVLDADTEAAVPWVATGYVAGPSLQQIVGHDHGPLPERSVRILAAGLAHALKDIHAAGIVHRDLKPSNVLLTIDGPRVIDFGIARALETVTDGGLTRTGALVGSPGFMAPEQVRGDRITPACDVFCLGSVLAYAATGALPFGGADSGVHALMFRIAQEEPDLEGVPEGIADLVRDCLRKDPAARPTLDGLLERTGAEDTVSDGRALDPWLPGALVAQLGRHAVRLLDTENPQTPGAPPEHTAAEEPDGAPASAQNGAPGGPLGAAGAAAPLNHLPTVTPARPAAPGPPAPGTQPAPQAAPVTPPPAHPAYDAPRTPPAPAGPPPQQPYGSLQGYGYPQPPHQAHPASPYDGRPTPSYDGRPPSPPHGYGSPAPAAGPYGGPAPHPAPYGGLGPTPPYGSAPYGTPAPVPPPEPARRNGRATALLVAVAVVVALAAGGTVYALMNGDADAGASPSPTPATTPATTGAPTTPRPASPSPSPSPSVSSSAQDGAIPADYLGTWTTTIDNASGTHTRTLTLRQGEPGDTVLSLTADGADYHCVFEAALSGEPAANGPLPIGPSTVTVGEPPACSPGAATEITLVSPDTLERVNTSTGEKLTYTRR
ncbi:serine/threonine protein kinase [Streptomyces pharetrae CZA14]|uniref:Serine/threonine protein kinase n=1 Tax=Streptomyces pharetrae CZA14 TaxID=1144883 RepID=A0ABX3YIC6_9ACTN|nr:serine/threonine protein kinase [Streptomyces pharetrae CZA14]